VQAGELAKDGAQVVLESVAEESGKRLANPDGLLFFPARTAEDAERAVERLSAAIAQAHAASTDVLRVTCFLGSSGDAPAAEAAAARAFPAAAKAGAIDMVQRLRAPSGPAAACEAVARGKGVTASKLVFTGAQMAFGDTEGALRLAFTRLEKTLEPFGATYSDVVFAGFYPAGRAAEEKLAPLTTEFFRNPAPPSSMLVFEGLPSPDASMSMDVIAAAKGDAVRN
jgi:enamine deaminase RidA (YjgF/YER057c/UK114 family)